MFGFFNSESIQLCIDSLLRYRWAGILCYLLFLSPFVYLLLAQSSLARYLPDNINYEGDSIWELLLGMLFTAILMLYFAASVLRAFANRQYLWLVLMLLAFPSVLLYLLLANTGRTSIQHHT